MSWFKLDDGWLTHPKVRRIGKDGRALWIAGGLHCAQHLTDGKIDKGFVPLLSALAEVKPGTWKVLVTEGLWADQGGWFEVHQYLAYQPSKAKVEAEREAAKDRQRRHRLGGTDGVGHGVTDGVTDAVTDAVTNGVSHTTPSRPVPSRPNASTYQHSAAATETPPEHAAAAAVGDPRIIEILDLAVRVRQATSTGVRHPIPWAKRVREKLADDHGQTIAAALTHPGEIDVTGLVATITGVPRTEVMSVRLGGKYL